MDFVSYSSLAAEAYGSLAISGTTYEIGFDAMKPKLGDLSGQVWLDFGSGAGRSSHFLRSLGAGLVFGVDHNPSMVRQARSHSTGGTEYAVIDQVVPLVRDSVDGAISCNVFIEMRSLHEMATACAEVHRVLRPGSPFVVMSGNPAAIGREYQSFSYPAPPTNASSGQRVLCVINTPLGPVEVEDTYWTRADYELALRGAGFTVREVLTPTSSSPAFHGTAEATVGPFMILISVKD
jgi:SAM-dependent methyltransferase